MARTIRHPTKHLVRWDSLDFHVKPNDIIGVKGISITGSCETEEKESGGEKYTSRKAAKGIEFSMTAMLNAYLTNGVKSKALEMVRIATEGRSGYLYMGTRKLLPSRFMLTSAKVQNITIAAGGEWVSCEVALTFKQASKIDGSDTPAASSGRKRARRSNKPTANTGAPVPVNGVLTAEQKAAIREANTQQKAAKKQATTSLGVKVLTAKQGKKPVTGAASTRYNEYR